MRQVFRLLHEINIREYNDFVTQARLRGDKKLKYKHKETYEQVKVSDETQEAIDKGVEEILKQKG